MSDNNFYLAMKFREDERDQSRRLNAELVGLMTPLKEALESLRQASGDMLERRGAGRISEQDEMRVRSAMAYADGVLSRVDNEFKRGRR
jgi:hypothetical protein